MNALPAFAPMSFLKSPRKGAVKREICLCRVENRLPLVSEYEFAEIQRPGSGLNECIASSCAGLSRNRKVVSYFAFHGGIYVDNSHKPMHDGILGVTKPRNIVVSYKILTGVCAMKILLIANSFVKRNIFQSSKMLGVLPFGEPLTFQ